MSLSAAGISYEVSGRRLLDQVSLRLEPGEVHAVLGPNGAGKSTLLRLLARELTESRGTIELNGKALPFWTPREMARQRSVLPQAHRLAFGFTSRQVVALGRLPCPRHRPEVEDGIVREALALAGVASLIDRHYPTLSGGERARVQLARVLAQVWEPLDGPLAGLPRYVLLDEPTASLDLAHQHQCLRAAGTLARLGVGVLAVLHDPNLALRYADTVTLLRDGRTLASGPPQETLTPDLLSRLYRIPVAVHRMPGSAVALIAAAPERTED